ncbi:phage major capsid protein [Ralstonia solanacearum]|uniref:phage major capsid protein n=1 Tax=Ralstonia pseudosolanacearum TaxID=1310165 RepID=UPI000C9FB0F5|nr:phage major capsid protein [Ralstonia pseudosolanacearum]AUS42549.1 phage major capsid protein [Ralstonia solanacearum]
MTQSIQALRERRDAIAKNVNSLMENHTGDKWGAEQQTAYDNGMADLDRINAEIKRNEEYLARLGEEAASGRPDGLINASVRTPGAHSEESRALRAYLSGGISAMADEDVQRMRARRSPEVQAAMSTSAGPEGGYTVAQEYYRQLAEAMRAYGGLRNLATVIPTSTGADLNFPAADATAEEGEIVGQNQAVSKQDTTFGNKSVKVWKYSSKSIAVPFELIQDSMFDIELYIRSLLAMRLGRITSKHFVIGDGATQPNGIVTASSVGKVAAAGQVNTVGYDDLVDLEHSVDPIYRGGPKTGWLLHDQTIKAVRKIKDNNGRPIFVPGYEQGNPGGAPDRLLNRPLYADQAMPQMAANAKSIAFGDYSKYVVREVMDLTLFRMADSKYIENGQIGFIAFNRQGGNLIDVGGAVKLYQNSAA